MTQKNNNGWTPERRAKQAEAIKKWKPWTKSTGPRTETGKTICARNAYKHGCRSRGALKLRAVMARHSRWLAGIVAASRLDLIRKIAAQKKKRDKRTNGSESVIARCSRSNPDEKVGWPRR